MIVRRIVTAQDVAVDGAIRPREGASMNPSLSAPTRGRTPMPDTQLKRDGSSVRRGLPARERPSEFWRACFGASKRLKSQGTAARAERNRLLVAGRRGRVDRELRGPACAARGRARASGQSPRLGNVKRRWAAHRGRWNARGGRLQRSAVAGKMTSIDGDVLSRHLSLVKQRPPELAPRPHVYRR